VRPSLTIASTGASSIESHDAGGTRRSLLISKPVVPDGDDGAGSSAATP